MKAKNFKLFIGYLGNGATVCNSAVYENGDYKTIAHITPAGRVSLYVDPDYIPADAMQRIKETAQRHEIETRERLEKSLNLSKYSTMSPEYAKMQEDHERARILDELSNYTSWAAFDDFWKTYTSAATHEEKNAAIIAAYMKNF